MVRKETLRLQFVSQWQWGHVGTFPLTGCAGGLPCISTMSVEVKKNMTMNIMKAFSNLSQITWKNILSRTWSFIFRGWVGQHLKRSHYIKPLTRPFRSTPIIARRDCHGVPSFKNKPKWPLTPWMGHESNLYLSSPKAPWKRNPVWLASLSDMGLVGISVGTSKVGRVASLA